MFAESETTYSPIDVELDAVTANEELAERITVVHAIAMISLPLPRRVEPSVEALSAPAVAA
jgi:hypothetical protein